MEDFMDNISQLSDIKSGYINNILSNSKSTAVSSDDSFANVFDAAKEIISDTNDYVKAAEKAEIDYALGNITSTHELAVAQQKAMLSMQYTVALRDAVVDAYKEIMQIQI